MLLVKTKKSNVGCSLQSLQAFNAQQLDDEVEIEKVHHNGGTNRNWKTLVAKTIAKMLDVL
jgi:hypothetical protein